MIRFAILDDHPLVVEGIRSLFQEDAYFQLVWGVTSVEQCMQLLQTTAIDVLLLDIHLEQYNGITLCKQLKEQLPNLHIIILTSYCETSFVKTALYNGASGYLLKNAGYKEISQALESVCTGNSYLSELVQQKMLQGLLTRKSATTTIAYVPHLTRREKEVLQLIVDEYTTSEIADKLFVSLKTIETHRMNLLQKLGAKNTAGLVKAALSLELLG
ncbi:response regulator transcription factor [Xanthocytophaga agilis]|uniref:Response regulator transcription factor n=1 Tax=Xanthocytophaga agilis TaxID=3048010 RepID=A0AAE3UCN2_9BACT|nr:response regulator transcription factor [Xanthocytophaga agilis]MDJ1500265.1 response regulator transcription factor [Xanthocytophaga agilis]